jgi:phenylacetic acid degradation operon negative regulatory protein
MDWQDFHHPNISWPVVRRHVRTEFMEMLELTALFTRRGGWAMINRSCYPSDKAYRSAKSRLLKQGLIASRSSAAGAPHVYLTTIGHDVIPAYFHPEKRWSRSWNRVWNMLVYDVPEVDRKYRNVIREFLKRKHLGQLQQSVWITPDDIRPDFDDLVQAANLDAYAYLFESKTVLGLSSDCIVESAWKLNQLQDRQEHFCHVAEINIAKLRAGNHTPADLTRLIRMTLSAYHAAMCDDPLLPDTLLPSGYAGKEAHGILQILLQTIDNQL